MYNLHRFLVDYDMTMLRALAQNRGLALATNRQADAADELAARLLDPLSVRTALARLGPQSREALEALIAAGGRMRAPHFIRRFGQIRPVGPGRLEREAFWQDPATPSEELWYAGLIFRAFAQDQSGAGEFVFVPEDLQPLLPQPRLDPPTFAVEVIPAPAHQEEADLSLVLDLFEYLVYIQNNDVHPYTDGRLGQRDLTALRGRLSVPHERRLTFLRHMAGRLGFVVRQDESLRLDASSVKRWLSASPDRQLVVLREAWRDDPTWNDLCHVPGLVCDQKTPWQNDPVATRRALLMLLARCPLGEWWSLASFVAAVKEIHPDFQRPDGDYTSWYIREAASGDYLSGFQSWDRVEGVLVADLLAGPLCWLGIVATAAAEEGTICRLTESGAYFLDLLPAEPADLPSSSIAVYADFRVEIPPPASLYTRFQLERFADLESLEPCRYRLSVSSLGRALARDIRVDQVLAFLQQASERPVPANVVGQLRLWAGRFGQVQLEEVAVLQVKSERVLKELSVLPETRFLIGEILSPTSALVRKQDLPRLRKELRALGYLPPEG
ncbi:MAG TPA: helicase-associated domain-containing protein [Anaerolineae bacterium]|nr:helicase-associated domain-containing protein [Anaerolineae bacterium]